MSASPPPPKRRAVENWFDTLPDEMVIAVFKLVALLDPETMLTVVHAACRRWRQLCGDTQGVRFELRFLPRNAKLRHPAVDARGGYDC